MKRPRQSYDCGYTYVMFLDKDYERLRSDLDPVEVYIAINQVLSRHSSDL
jgi:hypothetical protein